MCGTASCLCRKNIKSFARVDSPCPVSPISCHGQLKVRNLCQALTLSCSIGTLTFTVSSTVFQGKHIDFPELPITTDWVFCGVVAPVAHCQALLYIIGASFMLAMSATSMLFLYRVRAVFGNLMLITVIFGTLWTATAGLSVLVLISLFGDVSLFSASSSISSAHPLLHVSST